MFLEILIQIIIISIATVGLKICFGEGMIFGFVHGWGESMKADIQKHENKIAITSDPIEQGYYLLDLRNSQALQTLCKPIFGCITCMASVWGVIFYCLLNFGHLNVMDIPKIIITCLACAFLNTYLFNKIEK